MIAQIFEFNHGLLGVKLKNPPELRQEDVNFVIKALREEAGEMEDASTDFDPTTDDPRWIIVHEVDAAIDAAYFAIGLLARAGLTMEQAQKCFDAVDRKNKTKKLGVNDKRGDVGTVDARKPFGFQGPETEIFEIIFGEKPKVVKPTVQEK